MESSCFIYRTMARYLLFMFELRIQFLITFILQHFHVSYCYILDPHKPDLDKIIHTYYEAESNKKNKKLATEGKISI